MENSNTNTNTNSEEGKIRQKDYQGQELGAVDTNKESSFSGEDYEASGDAVRSNPSREEGDVSRRAGMNAGVSGIGEGSAQGYEGNTDDSGLPADEDLGLSSEDIESDTEVSRQGSRDASTREGDSASSSI